MKKNSNHTYYLREVLGMDSIIQPKSIRHIYQLHSTMQHPELLFFCEKLNQEGEVFIKKMAAALNSKDITIAEVMDQPPNHDILNNLCLRLSPKKGVIIFGKKLSTYIVTSLPCLTLYPLNQLLATSDSAEEKQLLNSRKKEVWQQLQNTFH